MSLDTKCLSLAAIGCFSWNWMHHRLPLPSTICHALLPDVCRRFKGCCSLPLSAPMSAIEVPFHMLLSLPVSTFPVGLPRRTAYSYMCFHLHQNCLLKHSAPSCWALPLVLQELAHTTARYKFFNNSYTSACVWCACPALQ